VVKFWKVWVVDFGCLGGGNLNVLVVEFWNVLVVEFRFFGGGILDVYVAEFRSIYYLVRADEPAYLPM
jgi:hypothetical protein